MAPKPKPEDQAAQADNPNTSEAAEAATAISTGAGQDADRAGQDAPAAPSDDIPPIDLNTLAAWLENPRVQQFAAAWLGMNRAPALANAPAPAAPAADAPWCTLDEAAELVGTTEPLSYRCYPDRVVVVTRGGRKLSAERPD